MKTMKTAKKTLKAKTTKKAAPAPEHEDGDEEDGEEEQDEPLPLSVVPERYKKRYDKKGRSPLNPVGVALTLATRDAKDTATDIVKLRAVAKTNGIDLDATWGHLTTKNGSPNYGMMRMNLGNVLAARVKKGLKVQIGDKTWKAVEKAA